MEQRERFRSGWLGAGFGCVVVLAWSLAPLPAAGAPFEIEGVVNISVPGDPQEGFPRSSGPLAVTALADQAAGVGFQGAHAESRYVADLATGTLGAFAAAANGCDPGCLSWTRALSWTHVRMQDTITVTVPPGTYEQGVWVRIPGVIEGTLAAAPDQYDPSVWARLFWEVRVIWDPGPGQSTWDRHAYDTVVVHERTQVVDAPYAVEIQLVGSGGTLSEALSADLWVNARLELDAYPYVEWMDASAEADFEGTLRITEVEVPAGVSWTSASGVFLPEPASSAQALTALAALLGWPGRVLRRRARIQTTGPSSAATAGSPSRVRSALPSKPRSLSTPSTRSIAGASPS